MNSFIRGIKIDKLNKYKKRLNFLKRISLGSLIIDITTFIILESIELYFDDLIVHMELFIYFIAKIITFIAVFILIFYSILYRKQKILLITAMLYLILGLFIFIYLIIEEMTSISSHKMKPITDTKPEIYYVLFLKLIIILIIIGGIFRISGIIFMLIYVRVSRKISKINNKLNEKFLDNNKESSVVQSKSTTNVSQVKTNSAPVPEKSIHNNKYYSSTFSEGKTIKESFINRSKVIPLDKSRTKSTNQTFNESYIGCTHSNTNIYINNKNDSYINCFSQVYNYQIKKDNLINQPITLSKNVEKDKDDFLGSIYETPKYSVLV